jgi:hypothetical protein
MFSFRLFTIMKSGHNVNLRQQSLLKYLNNVAIKGKKKMFDILKDAQKKGQSSIKNH